MAKIRVSNYTVDIFISQSGAVSSKVVSFHGVGQDDALRVDKNIKKLVELFVFDAESHGKTRTNAVADWLVENFGKDAEILEHDEVQQDWDKIY